MVIPIRDEPLPSPTAAPQPKPQEFVGNHKEFRIGNNHGRLRIIGNDNRVNLKRNEGLIEIVGNSVKLKVLHNSGEINYTGNNGRIYLGKESTSTKVHYSGNNGRVRMLEGSDLFPPTTKDENKAPEPDSEPTKKCFADRMPRHITINIKNNISLPDLKQSQMQAQHKAGNLFHCSNNVKVSNSTGNIFVETSTAAAS